MILMDTELLSKICKICKEDKVLSSYTKKNRGVLGVRAECNLCRSAERRQRYKVDPEYRKSILESQRIANQTNPQKNRDNVKKWVSENPDKVKNSKVKHRRENPQRWKEYRTKWKTKNKHVIASFVAHRAATKLRATPLWANSFFIKEAFHLARLRTKLTGSDWHVDHIVPLRSRLVCGLHSEQNLQVIPAWINKLKSNISWPQMP